MIELVAETRILDVRTTTRTELIDITSLVRNAVLIIHGTGGTGAQFLRPSFAGELFGQYAHSLPPLVYGYL